MLIKLNEVGDLKKFLDWVHVANTLFLWFHDRPNLQYWVCLPTWGHDMTVPGLECGGMLKRSCGGIGFVLAARRMRMRLSPALHGALGVGLAAAFSIFLVQPSDSAGPEIARIAVFDFELDDRSAGGGIVDQDPIDTENLMSSTDEARRILSASGRYSVVDTGSTTGEVISAGVSNVATVARYPWPRASAPINR